MLFDTLISNTPPDYPDLNAMQFPGRGSKDKSLFTAFSVVGGVPGLGFFNPEDLTFNGGHYADSNTTFQNYGFDISPNGDNALAVFFESVSEIRLIDTTTGSIVVTSADLTPENAVLPRFGANGEYATAFFTADSTIRILNVSDLTEKFSFDVSESVGEPICGEVSSENIMFYLDANGNIGAYNIVNETLLWLKDVPTDEGVTPKLLQISPDGKEVFCATAIGDSNHLILKADDGSVIDGSIPNTLTVDEDYSNSTILYHPDGYHVFLNTTGTTKYRRIIDVRAKSVIKEETVDGNNYMFSFSKIGSVVDIWNGSNSAFEQLAILPDPSGTLYFTNPDGVMLNDNNDFLIVEYFLGTVYQTIKSDIFSIKIVNETSLTLSQIIIDSPDDLFFGTSEESFEDVESLTLEDGPYEPGDELTVFFKVKTGLDTPLGEESVSLTVQGNE